MFSSILSPRFHAFSVALQFVVITLSSESLSIIYSERFVETSHTRERIGRSCLMVCDFTPPDDAGVEPFDFCKEMSSKVAISHYLGMENDKTMILVSK